VTSHVLFSLRVAASPQRAFDVFTSEIGAWWRRTGCSVPRPRSPGQLTFEPGLGGRFTETLANGKVFEIGRITAWEPGSRLAFTWRQATFELDQITHVEVRSEAVGKKTRVTVEHRWDSVPQEHVAGPAGALANCPISDSRLLTAPPTPLRCTLLVAVPRKPIVSKTTADAIQSVL
jgi:uncharacterized protein YndB with AHSA1/START domain